MRPGLVTVFLATFVGYLTALLTSQIALTEWVQNLSLPIDPGLANFVLGPLAIAVVTIRRGGKASSAFLAGSMAWALLMGPSSLEMLWTVLAFWTKFLGALMWWCGLPALIVWCWGRVGSGLEA